MSRRVGNKDLQELVDRARRDGWSVDFNGSGDKLKWVAPRGNIFFFSSVNAGGMVLQRVEADLKRATRQMPPPIPTGKPTQIKVTIGDVAKISLPTPLEKPLPIPQPPSLSKPVPNTKGVISIEEAVALIYDEIQNTKCSPSVASATVFNLFLVKAFRTGTGGAPTYYNTPTALQNALILKYPQYRQRNKTLSERIVISGPLPALEDFDAGTPYEEPSPPQPEIVVVDLGVQVRHLMDTPGLSDSKKQELLRVLIAL